MKQKRALTVVLFLTLLFLSAGCEEKPGSAEESRNAAALTIYVQQTGQWDPFTPSSEQPLWYRDAVYDSLLSDTGCLAESFSASPDGLQWSFTLRPGLCFSDGSPCTASEVCGAFDRYRDHLHPALAQSIASWQAGDDQTFVLTLHHPMADLTKLLSSPLGSVPVVNAAGLGTGPYVPEPYENGIILRRSEYCACPQKTPSVNEIRVQFFESDSTQQAVGSLKDGDMGVFSSDLDAVSVLAQEGYVFQSLCADCPCLVFSAIDAPEAAEPAFRRALSRFIDLTALNETLYAGLGKVGNSIFPENSPLYVPFEDFFHDPAEGNALLAQLGVRVETMTLSDKVTEYYEPIYAALKAQLEESGITFDYEVLPQERSDTPLLDGSWLLYPLPNSSGRFYTDFFSLLFPQGSPLSSRLSGTLGDDYAALSEAYLQASIADEGEKQVICRELVMQLQEGFAVLPFVARPQVAVASERIAEFSVYPDGESQSNGVVLYSIRLKP